MRYYKIIENDELKCIGIGLDGTEITQTEYETLLAQIRAANPLEDEVPAEIALEEIVEVLEGTNE